MGNGSKRHKTGCRTRLYATTGATRCLALMPGILVDTLLRTASCGGENLVYRSNLSRRIAEMADPSTFKPILPPLPATFSQSFSGVKDAPARGDHFPHIFWCKLPKLRKIIWFFFQKPIITATPIINHLRIVIILIHLSTFILLNHFQPSARAINIVNLFMYEYEGVAMSVACCQGRV